MILGSILFNRNSTLMTKKYFTSLLILVFGLLYNSVFAQNPQVSLNINSSYVLEGSIYTFTVMLNSPSTTPVVLNILTATGTAGTDDYTSLTTSVTIPPGELSSAILSIPTGNDNVSEPNETFTIIGTVTSANTSNITTNIVITIIDNDTPPTISLQGSGGVEGYSNCSYSFSLSNPYHEDIAIQFQTIPGTASTADYTSIISQTFIINAGETYHYFTIYITDDALIELDELFTLQVTVTSGNTTNLTSSSEILIVDNDTPPTVSLDGYLVTEGEPTMYLYPGLNRLYNSDVVVHLATTAGTAGTDDYTSVITDRTIPAGSFGTNDVVMVNITDDTLDEPRENFTIDGTVTSGNTANTNFSGTAIIRDNDGLPDFEIYGSSTLEEGSDANYYVNLTAPSNTDTVIQITTTDGTAGNLDYTPITTTVTIPAGSISVSPFVAGIVPTIFDNLLETNETFTINGTLLSGTTFNSSDALTITLLDDYNVHAHHDEITTVAGVGATFPLLANDTLHGLLVNPSDVIITFESNTPAITVNNQGVLTVPPDTPAGAYGIYYTLYEAANPGLAFSTVDVSINVKSPLETTYSLVYADTNGDGYTSAGDVVTYVISVTNIGNAPISDIHLGSLFSNGYVALTIIGGPIATLNAGATDGTTFYANYILNQENINVGASNLGELSMEFIGTYNGLSVNNYAKYVSSGDLIFSNGIQLKAFIDSNANGIQDEAEINFPLGHFNYEINNDGVVHNLYTTPGYLYESNPTTSYNLSYEIDAQYASNYTCAFSYPNVTVALGSGLTTYNFPIAATVPYTDLSVALVSYNPPPRPGFEYNNYIIYTNNSNQTITSGTVTYINDSAVSVIGDPGTVHTYDFTELLPFESRNISVRLQTPTIPTVALGQLVTNMTSITLSPEDIDPLNNTTSISQTIIGSWDPNDKTESHGGRILHSGFTANDYLTYTIHFENTGTANAINIKVDDVLDAKLEPSSIKMVDASAKYSLERIGNHLTWTFSGINLPPSTDDSITGKGYVTFQVKPKAGYALGDVIPNKGDIYFDFNPAIVTNTCTTEFVPFLGVSIFDANSFQYYPNPTSNIVTFSLKNNTAIDTIEVMDVLGKIVLSKAFHYNTATIDLSSLSNGIYLAKVKANGQEKTIKISKQ